MMSKLANDPAFWGAVVALCGLVATWAKAKAAEIQAQTATKRVEGLSAQVQQQAAAPAVVQLPPIASTVQVQPAAEQSPAPQEHAGPSAAEQEP